MNPDARAISELHASLTEKWHASPPMASADGFLQLVQENHLRNFELWHEEDIARRDDLGSERVRKAKRAIDRYNQERNDFVERMDEFLVAVLQPAESGVPRHSETPGMIIDRLSILALKEYHMREETLRKDAGEEHQADCREKLSRIRRQRRDLTECLAELFEDIKAQRRTFAVYYQFKMYNDPAFHSRPGGG
jgi:hypothetical protein